MEKNVCYPGIQDGETLEIAGFEFTSRFGDNNDLRSSDVLRRMQNEILPKIVAEVGEENLCTIKTDLTTLDGLRPYGVMESMISLPTIDFYRANGEIFNKYKPRRWCWLATPESARPNDKPYWILCVSPSGCVGFYYYYGGVRGVRPILILKSTIFESSEG